MAYLSSGIQTIGKPETLYAIIADHRLIVFAWSMLMGSLLVLRFGFTGAGFILLFEATKGYTFGERFLAESLIVYPLVYLIGTAVSYKKANALVSALAAWFIIFSREPYIPLALLLFSLIAKKSSVLLFLALSFLTIIIHPIDDYFFNVVTVSRTILLSKAEIQIQQVLLSPVIQLVGGSWNSFHIITAGLSVIFLALSAVLLIKQQWKIVFLLFISLVLSNLRPVPPGAIYYEAFHANVWYGLLIFSVLLLIKEVKIQKIKVIAVGTFIILAIYAIADQRSYLHERFDRQGEFTTNYALYQATGDTVRLLSSPGDTLFLDGWDDLIYWPSKLLSPYRYSWYTSYMPHFDRYRQVREEMFRDSPPAFYYGQCADGKLTSEIPGGGIKDYIRLSAYGRPTCLFIHQTKLASVSDEQWESVKKYGIEKPL